jgi:very-short-patch-repair endonuclease
MCEKTICDKYLNNNSIEKLASEYHVGKLKIKEILNKNNIKLRKRGGNIIKRDFIITDYKIEKYPQCDGFHYIAKSKNDTFTSNDYMNRGGVLTSYIEKTYNIQTPSLYDRRIYYQTTGNYWWEQWFNIIKVKNDDNLKKCPYCDWTTIDLDNKSGAFLIHLKNVHNLTIEEHLKKYPEDSVYFSKQNKLLLRKDKLEDCNNYVICPLCNEKLERITSWHLKHRHNMDYIKFKELYPNQQTISNVMIEQSKESIKLGNLCVSKNRFISSYEREIQNFLKENNINFTSNRQILIGKEIDLLIEDKKIGIEFDGLKFHTEWFGHKSHRYHLDKTLMCNEKGYGLIHIFEDEYVSNKDIVLNKILHILGESHGIKIYARKCTIKEIYKSDAEEFLNKYHIQGFSSSTIYLGAFFENELISVMCFKRGNLKNPHWELTRFASDYHYICCGVGGKLFKYFINEYKPECVISFADRRWTVNINNNLYTKLGFIIDRINPPDYRYYNERVDRFKRVHKMYFNKQKLHKKYNFPLTMTESEMTRELGYDRIWDCGLVKYVWKKNNGVTI